MTGMQRCLILLGVVLDRRRFSGTGYPERRTRDRFGADRYGRTQVRMARVRTLPRPLPLFSYWLNDTLMSTATFTARKVGDSIVWSSRRMLNGVVRLTSLPKRGVQIDVTFRNGSRDTVSLANVVPLGEDPSRVVHPRERSGHATSSACPARRCSVPATVPSVSCSPTTHGKWVSVMPSLEHGRGLTAIARRQDSASAELRRFRAVLPPGGWVTYRMYIDDHAGDWRDGMRMMFRDRWLYDLETFDTSLFQRADLAWIRSSYLLMLQFAWDQDYYDALAGQYRFDTFLTHWNHLVGGFEALMLWPTWPRLGVDQRNQWDMYKDLPGGLQEIRRQVEVARKAGTRYFIAYNPWDESTRREDHLAGMEDMLRNARCRRRRARYLGTIQP